MATIKRFEDLRVWQNARELVNMIYDATEGRMFAGDRALCWQIRDAAVSSMSNIAEGFERGSNKEFTQMLFVAKGSAGEVRSDIYVALDRGFIPKETFDSLYEKSEELSRKIMALIDYLRKSELKGDKFREDKTLYTVGRDDDFAADLSNFEL